MSQISFFVVLINKSKKKYWKYKRSNHCKMHFYKSISVHCQIPLSLITDCLICVFFSITKPQKWVEWGCTSSTKRPPFCEHNVTSCEGIVRFARKFAHVTENNGDSKCFHEKRDACRENRVHLDAVRMKRKHWLGEGTQKAPCCSIIFSSVSLLNNSTR